MYSLDKPTRIDKSFNITSVVEKGLIQNDMAQGDERYIEVSGYASRAYSADGKLVIDADQEHVDTFGFDLKRLKNGTLPILFNHDQKKAVGKVLEATYDKDGLLITAKIYKLPGDALTNYVYEAVKAGIISAFSVGMLVKAFDVVSQDGEDYLQLSESELIEVSLVAVPSNPEALFRVTNLKSITGEDKTVTLLAKSAIKPENADACNGFECAIKSLQNVEPVVQKEIEVEIKNTDEVIVVDEKETVLGVTPEALDQLEVIQTPPEPTPEAEDAKPVEGEKVVVDTLENVDTTNDKPQDAPKDELTQTPEEALHSNLVSLGEIDISKLSESELEQVYETLAPIIEQIESRVVSQVVEAMQESLVVTAPTA